MYRDLICRGGVPKANFTSFIFNKTIRGRNSREDVSGALDKWPLFNEYWEDKVYDTSDLTLESKLSDAQPAQRKLPKVSPRPAAQPASVS